MAKYVDETVEHGLVLAAREIAAMRPDRAFARLVDLYNRQPRLGTAIGDAKRLGHSRQELQGGA